MPRCIEKPRLWWLFLLFPLFCLIRLWSATWRISISSQDAQKLREAPSPLLFLIWHNRLFAATEIYRRFRKNKTLYGLVSASKDGAWLTAILYWMGVHAVRGSSSWRGQAAFAELIEVIHRGHDVAITPDGPRGPRYQAKPGAIHLSLKTHAPILLVSIHCSSAYRLKSWDHFRIPLPFSTLSISLDSYSPTTPDSDYISTHLQKD